MVQTSIRETATLVAAFAAMLFVGVTIQVLIPLLFPSVTVEFVGVRVFRSWSGFGLRETLFQALVASVFLGIWNGVFRPGSADGIARQNARQHAQMMIAVWVAQTLLQLIVGGIIIIKLSHANRPFLKATVLATVSIVGIAAALAVGFYFPAPLPDETFTVDLPDGGSVAVDYFRPAGNENLPAFVIFHGVEGATPLVRSAVHYVNAKAICDRGYATFFVRYFDASPSSCWTARRYLSQ